MSDEEGADLLAPEAGGSGTSTLAQLRSLPWGNLLPLMGVQVSQSIVMNSIFVYASFLVIDLGLADRDSAGNYAGFVAGAFFVGQALSSYAWGVLGDRLGKKRCLVAGTAGTLLTTLAFGPGASASFEVAVALRLCAGLACGNIGLVKASLGAMSTPQNQALCFGLVGLCWGLGASLGSLMGGIAARPAAKYALFRNAFWARFPYLLPNLIAAACSAVTLALLWAKFEEPVVRKRPQSARSIWRAQPLLAVGVYFALGAFNVLAREVLPLLMTANLDVGGYHFGTDGIGVLNALGSAAVVVFFLVAFQPVVGRLGLLNTLRLGVVCLPAIMLVFPFLGPLAVRGETGALWVSLTLTFVLQLVFANYAFSPTFAIISNSVPQAQMGALHGLSQTMVAIARCVSPVICGTLFAWSLAQERPFPSNVWFLFVIVAVCFLALFAYTFLLSPSLNKPHAEEEQEEEQEQQVKGDLEQQ